ncbi:ribonuclease H-like [Mercenaria mercenaria]|uniref:ribonuclease H-like n=1 Tax=Mercenaria mercenaria TaxID=6596 RepID=UPI00234F8D42|nr:ribonuclease H-like [Mercenaria mercenaria]
MKAKLEGLTKNRLKRGSFAHEAKKLNKTFAKHLGQPTTPFTVQDLPEPWKHDQSNLTIRTNVPGLSPGTSDEMIKLSFTQAMIQDTYPSETWTHVFTDGSASAAIKGGGAGIFILYTSGRSETNSIPTGRHCTNYRAEVEAIKQAIKLIEESPESCPNVIIFTDALSVLQALENSKQTSISRVLFSLCKTRAVSLQWIPAHCGVPGNENADRLVKLGAEITSHKMPLLTRRR